MSGKIKSKDLSYDSSLPPFLQRLHAQKAGRGDTDRHEREIARPRRAKDPNDEDGPTVVDASGETLTKDEVDKLTSNTNDSSGDAGATETASGNGELGGSGARPDTEGIDDKHEAKRVEEILTDGTVQKKRKAGRIVGDEQEGEEDGQEGEEKATKPAKKLKKKTKPIKLAFDDD